MRKFVFELWWACHEQPFNSAHHCIEIVAEDELDAVARVISRQAPAQLSGHHWYIAMWQMLGEIK